MKKKLLPVFISIICMFFIGEKENLNDMESCDKYICCMATNKINQIYKIKFSKAMPQINNLNAYLPQKNNDNIISGLKNLLPHSCCSFIDTDFSSSIKINSGGQKYFSCNDIHNQDEAIQKAKEIMKNFFLYSTNNTYIKKTPAGIQIKFCNILDGIKNYSFCNYISFDKNFGLRNITYYNITYKKIGSYKIKPLSEAINNLPINFPDSTSIVLTQYEFCYIYSDSIVQGAYLFSGLSNKNEEVNFVVKASKYS